MPQHAQVFGHAIIRLKTAVNEAFNRGDVKSCAAFYSEDAIMFLPDRAPIKRRDAIEAILIEFSASGMKLAPVDPLQVRSAGDMGCCAGTYKFNLSLRAGRPVKETGRFVTVSMRQAGGSWKAVMGSLMQDERPRTVTSNYVTARDILTSNLCHGSTP